MEPVKIGDGLWTMSQPLKLLGLDLGTRMTIVGLPGPGSVSPEASRTPGLAAEAAGGVALISPIKHTPETAAAIARLVTPEPKVRALVAPNQFHHLYIGSWQRALKEQGVEHTTACAPGLPRKRRELEFDKVLVDDPPSLWAGTLEQHVVGGIPRASEVVFFHPSTRTLITTDLLFHIVDGNRMTRAWASLTGCYRRPAFPIVMKMIVRDRVALRASIDRILAWDFDRIVVTHGANVESRGRAALQAAFSFL